VTRWVVLPFAAAIIALLAAFFALWAPAGPQPALAGPCADDPELYFENFPVQGVPDLYTSPGRDHVAELEVVTFPGQLPPGKPPVTIDISSDLEPGISIGFDPPESDGTFFTDILVFIGPEVPPDAYDHTITVVCHEQESFFDFTIWVSQCPANQSSGSGGSSPEPWPETCEEPDITPTATPTPFLTPTPTGTLADTPTLSPTPAPALTQGNVDCRPPVNSVDALQTLLHVARLPTNVADGCPEIASEVASLWGDVNCDDAVDSLDALIVLLWLANLPYSVPAGCPDIGEPL